MRVLADENGWELVETANELVSSTPPISATPSSNAPGSGVFRKVVDDADATLRVDDAIRGEQDAATMPTDPAPASGDEEGLDADVRLPMPARLPADLTGDKARVA